MTGFPTTRAGFKREIDRAIAAGDKREAVMLMFIAIATIGPSEA